MKKQTTLSINMFYIVSITLMLTMLALTFYMYGYGRSREDTMEGVKKIIVENALKDKALGIEGKFLYTPKSTTVCIEMVIGKEPKVLAAEVCNK